MKPLSTPTNSLWLDARFSSPLGCVRTLESTLLRLRPGARRVVVKVSGRDVLDAVVEWAEELDVPWDQAVPDPGTLEPWIEVHLYLLPVDFDLHPFQANPRRSPILQQRYDADDVEWLAVG